VFDGEGSWHLPKWGLCTLFSVLCCHGKAITAEDIILNGLLDSVGMA